MSAVDEPAFTAIFEAEYPRVVRTVAVVVGDWASAEDVASEAFAQLLRHWSRVEGYERPDAWVRTVALRLAVRRERRRRMGDLLERLAARPERVEVDPTRYVDLLDAVATLPMRQRAVVALFYLEDRPLAEVAEILGCTSSTASVHLHRARRRLAECLSGAMEVSHDVG